jgi:hypothetical protein
MNQGDDAARQAAGVGPMPADEERADLDQVVRLAVADGAVLRRVLNGLVSKDEKVRYNCYKVLAEIAESQPRVLDPAWDTLVGLLDSPNAFHRATGVNLIAILAGADPEGRFERIFDRYFDLLSDDKVMVARYLAQSAGRIARAKPHLQARIVDRLLRIDRIEHKHKDLIKADVIASFGEFFEGSPDQERMRAFVEQQVDSSSPTTWKAARQFLDRYGG